MAAKSQSQQHSNAVPVVLYWDLSNDEPTPQLNVDETQPVFDAYDVDGMDALADRFSSGAHRFDPVRLGRMQKTDGDVTFTVEAALLQSVHGVTPELAEGLVDEFDDIPSLCKEYRIAGDVFLGDLSHDVGVEGRDWAGDLEALIQDLGERDTFEARLKNAGVWVEPDDAVAGGH